MIWPLRKSPVPEGPHPDSSIIFIVGCGRSGTHWLGYILDAHPDIVATIEKRSIFRKVTAMALDQSLMNRYFPRAGETPSAGTRPRRSASLR